MASADSLVLELLAKTDGLTKGLSDAVDSINDLADKFEGVGEVLEKFEKSSQATIDKLNDSIESIGTTTEDTADGVENSTTRMFNAFSRIKNLLIGLFGTKMMFDVAYGGTELDRYQKRTGLDTAEIDAWGKATEKAGGSAEALREAIKEWKIHGRSEEDFFAIGDRMKGMNAQERSWTLKAWGVNESAGALFLEQGDKAREVAQSYRNVAITDEQQKVARQFVDAFYDLQVYVEAIGRRIGGVILPVATNLFKRTKAFLDVLLKNGKAVEKITITIGAILALKWILGFKTILNLLQKITIVQKLINALTFANPIGIIIGAFVLAIALIDDFVTWLNKGDSLLFSWLGSAEEVGKTIDGWIDSFAKFMDGIEQSSQDFVKTIVDSIASAFTSAYSAICGVFDEAYKYVEDTFITPIEKFIEGIASGFNKVKSFFGIGEDEKKNNGNEPRKTAQLPETPLLASIGGAIMETQANRYGGISANPMAQKIVAGGSTTTNIGDTSNPTINITTELNYQGGKADFQEFGKVAKATSNDIGRKVGSALSGVQQK